jgi:hypothetical protein
MAAPVIQDADTKSGTVGSNLTSWTLTYPTNIQAGDLLLLLIDSDGSNALNGGGGWTRIMAVSGLNTSGGTEMTLAVLARIADGSETGTFSWTVGANSEQGQWRILRITGWYGSGLPAAWTSGLTNDGNGVAVSAIATVATGGSPNASNAPNPPAFNPANWNLEDTLWIAAMGWDHSDTIANNVNYGAAGWNLYPEQDGGSNGSGLFMARNSGPPLVDQGSGDTYMSVAGDGGITSEACGQSFDPAATTYVKAIAVTCAKYGSPTDGLVVELRSGSCSGTLLGTSGVQYPSTTDPTYSPVTFNFASPIAVTSGTTYYLVVRRVGTRDTNNYYRIRSSSSSVYAGGTAWGKQNGSWTSAPAYDLAFSVLGLVASLDPPTITLSGIEEWAAATIAIRPAPPVRTQSHFRFRNDDGNETAATWKDALDANINLAPNDKFRLRFALEDGVLGNDPPLESYLIVLSTNGGGYGGLLAGMNNASSDYVVGSTPTTQLISSGSFVPGLWVEYAGPGTGNYADVDLGNNTVTELEFTLAIPADAVVGTTYDFHLVANDGFAITYTHTPRVTVVSGQTPTPPVTANEEFFALL